MKSTAVIAQTAQARWRPSAPWAWFREFLKDELAPYPGRAALTARIVIAATVVMIVNMTFRIPYGAYGAIYAITIPRQTPEVTLKEVRTIVIGYSLAVADILLGAMVVLGTPAWRLLWVIANLFAAFYAMRALTNVTVATRFGYLLVITIPLWDRHIPAEARVEGTLWAFAAITLASVITLALEFIHAGLSSRDPLLEPVGERLACIEKLLTTSADGRPIDGRTEKQITSLAMQGTSRLRTVLLRSGYEANYREQMGAVLAIVGRMVDIAANLAAFKSKVREEDREHVRAVAQSIAGIRADLLDGKAPGKVELPCEEGFGRGVPLLCELEAAVRLLPEVFAESERVAAFAPPSGNAPRASVFAPGALSNTDYIKFGLRGCFAASLCYIIYTAAAWPEISTSVTTCLLTALSSVGASRQKQILRFAGALAGGAVGIGAQVFILPYLDSIAGFTVLFVAVSIPAAWIVASGPRLSYFGVQVAVAFYLINVQEYKMQTSLLVARDRVLGVLLGLFVMWLAFDQLWSAPAMVQMKSTFVKMLRLLAQFAREPQSSDLRTAAERSYDLREAINTVFDNVRANGDAVLFEFGPSRRSDLDLRGQILELLPRLRTFFVTQIALWKYRASVPGFVLPGKVRLEQQKLDHLLADRLDRLADQIEGRASNASNYSEPVFDHVEIRQPVLAREFQGFLRLSRTSEKLISSLPGI